MNCKQGDLAIVIRSVKMINVGKLVRCLKFFKNAACSDGTSPDGWVVEAPWAVVPDARSKMEGGDLFFPDAWLKPIRDPGEDATDETLGWLPVPNKEHA